MSKASTRKRNRITLALGAFSVITFGSMYGLIAHNAALDQSAAVASTPGAQTTALVLTDVSTVAATAVPAAATTTANSATTVAAAPAPTAAPTAVPTAQPMVAKVDTSTRPS